MRLFLLLLLLYPGRDIYGQTILQTVRGVVVDKDSRRPLDGATVTATGSGSTVTDSAGRFVLPAVPVGRVRIECSYVGYGVYTTDNLLVTAAKQPGLLIELEEKKGQAEEVVVHSVRNPKLPVNRFALAGGRSFSPEETQRVAASANDPSRMALGFPGVQATRDNRSDIIIRGNNPAGMQWRLEGIDIPNPNHFARKGSSGGGITIFSLSMLGNSDFLTGALPAEYGDVLSGVFDMHLRQGNNQRTEHTFKAGMIGLDFSSEGPITKGRSSYLANYRYSTLGLLNTLGLNLVGERESNNFQDLSFNLAFANRKNTAQWNVWGIGGYSRETLAEVEDTLQWKQYNDYAVYDFRTKMGALGFGHTLTLSAKSFLKSALVLTGQEVAFIDDTLSRQKRRFTVNNERYGNSRLSFTTSFNQKFSAAATLKTGVFASALGYRLRQEKFDYPSQTFRNFIDGEGTTALLQPYVQMSLRPGTRWTINPGLHGTHLALNGKTTVDPRLSVQYRTGTNKSLTLAYGLHSKVLPLGSYFFKGPGGDPYPNKDLDMMRSHHMLAAWDQLLGKGWRLHAEGYYQRLLQIPVVDDRSRTFWLLNELEGYARETLVSKGKGTNKGIDVSLEKTFDKGLFMIAAFSVFRSTYEPLNGVTYSTRFNSGTSGSWTGAKEWGLKRARVFQLGWKMVYNGGLPLTPLAPGLSTTREAVLDESRPYSERVPAYFRTDTRFALRKDKTKISWQLALDVQNILGIKNVDGLSRRYDPSVNGWIFREQSGLVPVLSYQIDF